MFSNFGYSRRPPTITTYKRKRNDPLPATLSDDDSDLDEPILSTKAITRSSHNVKLGNNISYDTFSTTATIIQHPISTFLDKQLEINTRDISAAFEEDLPPQQQQVEITQALQPHQSNSISPSSPTIQPVVQSSSVVEYQEQPASSFSIPTIENNSSTLGITSLNLLETSQHVQQQYQIFDTSFQISSQPLPSVLDTPFDWMTLGSTFEEDVPVLPSTSDTLMLLQPQVQQQQQQEFRLASNNGPATGTIAPKPIGCDNSFITIQPTPPQSVVPIDTSSNIATTATTTTNNNNYTNKENNVTPNVYLEPESVITSTTISSSPAPPFSFSSSSSSSSSSFDIRKIPEIPTPSILPRFIKKQSSKGNSNTSFDVFDFPLENNVPKVTKKYQSPTKQTPIVPATATSPTGPETVKKIAKQTQFDIFDFPEDDDTKIVELKMISTPSPSLLSSSSSSSSSCSLPATHNNERDKKPPKRYVSHANNTYTTPNEPLRPRHQQHQQKRKPPSLKKSKSDTPSSLGRRVRFAPEILISTFYRTSLDRSQPFCAPTFSEETVKETEECSFSVPPSQQQQLPIKRKRNLVSKLRGATGAVSMQTSNCPSLRKYNFDDDDDDDENDDGGGEENVVETTKMMDEDDEEYRQRMQRELVAIMQNEFGQEDEQEKVKEKNQEQENISSSSSSSRPQYQPKNAMNVRVTYKSSKRHHHLHQDIQRQQGQDREMIELDNLLDKLRAGGTDL